MKLSPNFFDFFHHKNTIGRKNLDMEKMIKANERKMRERNKDKKEGIKQKKEKKERK